VFPTRAQPTTPRNIETCWRQALARAQLRRFRFHDLRHDCASQLARSGASLLQIADVLGHRQLAMVRRYAHLTTASKAALVNKVLGNLHAPAQACAAAEGGAS
jgi:integrase